MKAVSLVAAMILFLAASAMGQGKLLTTDPMTGLPLIGATDNGMHFANIYNEPTTMPSGQVCKSKEQGEFYSLFKIKVDAAVAWYSSHLPGFKKMSGYDGSRSQTAFYNADGTVLVIVTGSHGAKGENTDAYSVAYEKYQPGISEKVITGATTGNIDCR
jgi:hypothetical protein